nr:RNA-directed DNA polymerase, eukaryota [Tanacetum cinerariifolium]
MFRKEQHIIFDNFVALYGTWISNKVKMLLISVYAPQVGSYKRILWTYLDLLINRWNGECIVMGDFNEVRRVEERWGSSFNIGRARMFNNFISNAGLIDLQLEAYDSIRWDYLEEVLRSFGFVPKWRSWICGCLNSSMASIFINGSPTTEFQFHRGLKQGDPIDPSIMISHLFYADDVVFIGEWSQENHKGVPSHFMKEAADLLGCSVMKTPFNYLGITVGGSTSLVKTLDETINKLKLRLSNWKLKTLSIGERFTLIKYVLGSTPIYNMSLYKVPKTVLNAIESIRRNFFNGIQDGDKKISWIKWAKVLTSKDHGGLGVSSFNALNRALLLKWVWRFLSRDNSLLFRTIYAIYGSREQGLSAAFSFNWSSIIKEVKVLYTQGIDFTSHCKIKVGNGRSTSFWKDLWIGDTRLCHKFPRLFALDVNKEGIVASKLSVVEPGLASFRFLSLMAFLVQGIVDVF